MDELISRSDAIKAMNSLDANVYGWSDTMIKRYDAGDVIEALRNVPTAAGQDTAEWIKLKSQVVCSKCRHVEGKYKHREYRFCPWCGRRMKGDES